MRNPAPHLAVLQAASGTISLPTSTAEGRQSSQLPLLHSAVFPNARSSADSPEDHIGFAGGPVWALEPCPKVVEEQLHIAIAAHPRGREQNAMAATAAGPVLLQIWSLPVQPPSPATALTALSPRRDPRLPASAADDQRAQLPSRLHFKFGIALDGGIVRDCRWCPTQQQAAELLGGMPNIASRQAPLQPAGLLRVDPHHAARSLNAPASYATHGWRSLGLLAVVLGTGGIQLVWVPQSAEIKEGSDDITSIMEAPLAAALAAEDLGGSCASCLEWLPSPPHDLILVGCFDGTAAMLRLLPASAAGSAGAHGRMQAVLHFAADADPVRAVAWAHPSICSHTSDAAGRFLFATAGHGSHVQVWDARDPAHAIADFMVPGRTWILALIWTPTGLLVVQDDGSLHILNVGGQPGTKDSNVTSFTSGLAGALWDCCQHPRLGHVAYTGADGEVIVAEKDFHLQRIRPAHQPVAGFRERDGVLQVCTGAEMTVVSGAFSGRNATSAGSRVASPREAVHRVRWLEGTSSGSGSAAWLAHAGSEGLLRCQYLDFG